MSNDKLKRFVRCDMTNDGVAIHNMYELQDTGQRGTGKLPDGTPAHPGFRHACISLRCGITDNLGHAGAHRRID